MEDLYSEIQLSDCTKKYHFESMKDEIIHHINNINNVNSISLIAEIEGDGFITCMSSIDNGEYGHGNYYYGVRFLNPESIINFIRFCAGHTNVGTLGFSINDLSETETEIILVKPDNLAH